MESNEQKIPNIKKFLPWTAAILILLFLFWRIDIQKFIEAINSANLIVYFPLILFFILIWFFFDSQNLFVLFKYFGHEVPFRDVLKIRGTTYLLMVLNYNLGVGGIALYIKKLRGIALPNAISILLFFSFIDIVSLSFLSIIGSFFSPESTEILDGILFFSALILLIYCTGIIIFKHLPDIWIFKKIKNLSILNSFHHANWKLFLLLPVYRGLYFITFIVFFYIAIKAFHMYIPVTTLAALLPVILIISTAPVTPAGIGTMQAAMLIFFGPYSSEPKILALSISYNALVLLLRILIGIYYLKQHGGPDAAVSLKK